MFLKWIFPSVTLFPLGERFIPSSVKEDSINILLNFKTQCTFMAKTMTLSQYKGHHSIYFVEKTPLRISTLYPNKKQPPCNASFLAASFLSQAVTNCLTNVTYSLYSESEITALQMLWNARELRDLCLSSPKRPSKRTPTQQKAECRKRGRKNTVAEKVQL